MLRGLRTALNQSPAAGLFLLYSPGADDPLGLRDPVAPPNEDMAAVHAPAARPHARTSSRIPCGQLPAEHQSRVIELDCRKVAAYLLESHPGLDDPLFEESVALADAYAQGQPASETEEARGRHVAGWLVSTDSAAEIARRFARAERPLQTRAAMGYGLAWHDPRVLAGLWPGMSARQRLTLLGEHTEWFAVDAAGQLQRWFAGGAHAPAGDIQTHAPAGDIQTHAPASDMQTHAPVVINVAQAEHLQDAPAVLRFLELWREHRAAAGQTLPGNAQAHLHQHVRRARQLGLDGEDLQTYVFFAITLRPGFDTEPAVRSAIAEAVQNPDTLAQTLPAALSGALLAQYTLNLHDIPQP
jgi:hypothetical protein